MEELLLEVVTIPSEFGINPQSGLTLLRTANMYHDYCFSFLDLLPEADQIIIFETVIHLNNWPRNERVTAICSYGFPTLFYENGRVCQL